MPTLSLPLLIGFQLASTALTVKLKAVPADWAVGDPVLPVALPGAAVSPGTSSCSFANAPGFTVTAGLVLAATAVCVMFEAVSVRLPTVLSVTLKVWVPATSAALEGKAAFASLEVMPTVSLVLIGFQQPSTALTVTVKAVPAVCAVGVPVLPVALPGAAVSPGNNSCSLASVPGVIVMGGLVSLVFEPSVTLVAVMVQLPLVQLVRVKDLVPETKAVLVGKMSFVSVQSRPTKSLTMLTTFQSASTALTVTL